MVADVSMTSHWFYPGSVSWILLDAHCLNGHKCRALLTHIMTVFSNKYHCHKSIFHFLLLMSCVHVRPRVHHIDLHFKAGYRLSSAFISYTSCDVFIHYPSPSPSYSPVTSNHLGSSSEKHREDMSTAMEIPPGKWWPNWTIMFNWTSLLHAQKDQSRLLSYIF